MEETLNLVCRVRFSSSQWEQIREHALRCGMKPTTYVRHTALGAVPRQRRRARESDIVYHLGRIGNNLNQLTRRHNSGEPVARAEVLAVLEQVVAAVKEI